MASVGVERRFWPLLWFLLRVEPGRCFLSSPVDVRVRTRKVFLSLQLKKQRRVNQASTMGLSLSAKNKGRAGVTGAGIARAILSLSSSTVIGNSEDPKSTLIGEDCVPCSMSTSIGCSRDPEPSAHPLGVVQSFQIGGISHLLPSQVARPASISPLLKAFKNSVGWKSVVDPSGCIGKGPSHEGSGDG